MNTKVTDQRLLRERIPCACKPITKSTTRGKQNTRSRVIQTCGRQQKVRPASNSRSAESSTLIARLRVLNAFILLPTVLNQSLLSILLFQPCFSGRDSVRRQIRPPTRAYQASYSTANSPPNACVPTFCNRIVP